MARLKSPLCHTLHLLMSRIFLSTLNQNKQTVSKGNQQKDDNQCEKQSEI